MTTVTAETLRSHLRAQYAAPAWAFFEEVRNQTGYGKRERYADALALGLWPSHGMELIGFEIKVSRGDWKRELADPTKAAEFQKWCDRWFIVAPKGIVAPIELPATWGLIELNEKNKLRIVKAAKETKPEPLDRRFIASLCRNINDGIEQMARDRAVGLSERAYATQLASLEAQKKRAEEQLATAQNSLREVGMKLGISLFDLLHSPDTVGERIRRAMEIDGMQKHVARQTKSIVRELRSLMTTVQNWEDVAQRMESAAKDSTQ